MCELEMEGGCGCLVTKQESTWKAQRVWRALQSIEKGFALYFWLTFLLNVQRGTNFNKQWLQSGNLIATAASVSANIREDRITGENLEQNLVSRGI